MIWASPLTIQPLDGSGIFTEPIGQAIIYSSQWTLAGSLEVPDWEISINLIENSKIIIEEFCNKSLVEDQFCTNWKHRLDNRIRDSRDRIEHIRFFDNKSQRLSKRGWIDAVGHTAKFLFGVMDSDDEVKINDHLKRLENTRSNSWNFMEKQITVMYDNFNMITGPLQILKRNQYNISNTINKIISQNENLTKKIASLELTQRLEEQLEASLENLDTIIRSLNKFTTIYYALISHKLPIELIETSTLLTIYGELVKEKHLNLKLIKKEIFFEIASTIWTQNNGILIYKIKCPTEMSESFDVSEIIPYPIKQITDYVIPKIDNKILFVSQSRQLLLSNDQFSSGCKGLRSFEVENLYLCKSTNINKMSNRIHGSVNIPILSTVRLTSLPEMKIRLTNPNSFLFSFQISQKIFSICDGHSQESELKNIGICTLNNSCIHSTNNELIPTFKEITSKIPNTKIQLNLNFQNISISINNETNSLKPLNFNSSDDFQKYFNKIDKNFMELRKSEEEFKNKEYHQTLSIGSVSMSGTSLVIIAIILVFLYFKLSKKSNNITINSAHSDNLPALPPRRI